MDASGRPSYATTEAASSSLLSPFADTESQITGSDKAPTDRLLPTGSYRQAPTDRLLPTVSRLNELKREGLSIQAISESIPLLGFGERLHPELDAMFLSNPDRFLQQTLSGKELRQMWDEINESLWTSFSLLSPPAWLQKHTSVSADDFVPEPHRNRFAVLLSRTEHIAYHLGQAALANQTT